MKHPKLAGQSARQPIHSPGTTVCVSGGHEGNYIGPPHQQCEALKCVPSFGKQGQCNHHTIHSIRIPADPVSGYCPRYVCVIGSGEPSGPMRGKTFQMFPSSTSRFQGSRCFASTALNVSRDPAPEGQALGGEVDSCETQYGL